MSKDYVDIFGNMTKEEFEKILIDNGVELYDTSNISTTEISNNERLIFPSKIVEYIINNK